MPDNPPRCETVLVLVSYGPSLINFRGHLLAALAENGRRVIACAPGWDPQLIRQVEQLGAEYRSIYMDRAGLNPVRDLKTLLGLIALLRELQPDHLLNFTIKPVIYGSLAGKLCRRVRVSSVVTGLGYAFLGATRRRQILNFFVRRLYRFALKSNQVVFFQNPDDRRLFVTSGMISQDKSELINGSGVDLEHFRAIPPQLQGPVFLLIARMLKEKGIREYVAAAAELKKKYPGARFQLLGPFDDNPSVIERSWVMRWQENGVIEYIDEKTDVRPFIAGCSVYVLPSYREGTPRSVLEAMAMARPVITTDVPGCRETVIEGKTGFLVPAGNVEALAAAMERLILKPDLIPPMGSAGRKLAEAKYEVGSVNAKILAAMNLNRTGA